MLEELRIQCPACGIILDVRNSRHEAVKQIVCPNCKKQLAIDFQEKPLLSNEYVEVRAVRIANGGIKRILRVKRDGVMLNGQPLQVDDEVVLQENDELNTPDCRESSHQTHSQEKPKDVHAANHNWLFALAACAIIVLAIVFLWPSKSGEPVVQKPSPDQADSIEVKIKHASKISEKQPKKKAKTEKATQKSNFTVTSDYDLEQLARQGNADAQYQLGIKQVRKVGANNVILGVNYLHQASKNGSSKADDALQKVLGALKRKAADGDSIAIYILNSIE